MLRSKLRVWCSRVAAVLLAVQAILRLGGSGPKSASRLNFPLAEYDLHEIAAMDLPGSAADRAAKVRRV